MKLPDPPTPVPAGYIARTEYFVTVEQATAYGRQCAEAMRNACADHLSNEYRLYGAAENIMEVEIE